MGLFKLELIAKIRSFYVSNVKKELSHIGQQHTEDELCKIINDSTFLQYEDNDENTDDGNSGILDIPNHEVRVLIIDDIFKLKDIGKKFSNEDDNENESSDFDNNDSDSDNSGNNYDGNYNVEELVQ